MVGKVISSLVVTLALTGAELGFGPGITAATPPTRLYLPVVARSSAPTPSPVTIGLADQGQTVLLVVGQPFTVELGGPIVWRLSFAPIDAVETLSGARPDAGTLGTFRAVRPGPVLLEAEGRPDCPTDRACITVIYNLTVFLDVSLPPGTLPRGRP